MEKIIKLTKRVYERLSIEIEYKNNFGDNYKAIFIVSINLQS
jgi:hypothetical protein